MSQNRYIVKETAIIDSASPNTNIYYPDGHNNSVYIEKNTSKESRYVLKVTGAPVPYFNLNKWGTLIFRDPLAIDFYDSTIVYPWRAQAIIRVYMISNDFDPSTITWNTRGTLNLKAAFLGWYKHVVYGTGLFIIKNNTSPFSGTLVRTAAPDFYGFVVEVDMDSVDATDYIKVGIPTNTGRVFTHDYE